MGIDVAWKPNIKNQQHHANLCTQAVCQPTSNCNATLYLLYSSLVSMSSSLYDHIVPVCCARIELLCTHNACKTKYNCSFTVCLCVCVRGREEDSVCAGL